MLDEVQGIAKQAGEAILGFYKGETAVDYKADDSPLTQADRAAHELIVDRLRQLTPDCPVISEESDPSGFQGEVSFERFWLVDPLDGTKEFIKETGEFTVNIALVVQGRPVLGVVYAPGIGVSYLAELPGGAWRQENGESLKSVQTRRPDPDRLWVVASRDHAGPEVARMMEKIPNVELTSMGSSLKFCLVAEGSADLYPRLLPTREWDTAAAQCVVEAAGGGVYDLEGQPLRYRKTDLTNPSIIAVGDPAFDWKQYLPD